MTTSLSVVIIRLPMAYLMPSMVRKRIAGLVPSGGSLFGHAARASPLASGATMQRLPSHRSRWSAQEAGDGTGQRDTQIAGLRQEAMAGPRLNPSSQSL
jgi:hypothetical protein